jgi:hypothetical protein
LEHAGDAGPDLLRRWPAAGATAGPGCAGKVEQMFPLGLIELQRPGERIEHALGHAGEVPALELGVVLDADTGQVGDLAAAQARHASATTEIA